MQNNTFGKKSWAPAKNGYERTQSPVIISKTVTRLKEKRIPVYLAFNKTKLGFSFIFEKTANSLSIDKPSGCPENISEVRVIFKDNAKLANQFTSRIISSSADTLVTAMPETIFRLQRRSSFRIDVPRGSYVSFKVNDQLVTGIPIKNISATGMLFCCRKNYQLHDSILDSISLAMPVRESNDILTDWELRKIDQGKVVRFFHDKSNGSSCFGVNFDPKPKEENDLVQYVRQRELELLRKGILY